MNTAALPRDVAGEISHFYSTTALLKDLQLPLELTELDSDHVNDMKEYINTVHSRSFCNMSEQWLPLRPTKDDKGEGLSFPPHSGRLRSLLLRELDSERISITQEALVLEHEAQ